MRKIIVSFTLVSLLLVGLMPTLSVEAVSWGNRYIEPPTINQQPGFIPFNQIFAPLSVPGNAANVIRDPSNQYDVGVEVNPNQTNQSGAIWSKDRIVDLSADSFQASMALFFGQVPKQPGDGMAFALTGVQPTVIGNNGASIGVWGSKDDDSASAAATNTKTLKKSFVVAFDTYPNADDLDLNIWKNITANSRQYIAHGYPNLASNYDTRHKWWGNRAILNPPTDAVTRLPNNLSDGTWHTFNVNWQRDDDRKGGTLTYQFETGGALGLISQAVHWTDSDINRIFGTQQLYLGFTGSTGSSTEANVASFRAIPGVVAANGQASLSRNQQPVDATTELRSGDHVESDYTLTSTGDGRQPWPLAGTLTAVLNKPQGLSYLTPSGAHLAVNQVMRLNATINRQPITLSAKLTTAETLTITDIPAFALGATTTLHFSLPLQVEALTPGSGSHAVRAQTGSVYGDNAQILFQTTTADNTLDYLLVAPPAPITPPQPSDEIQVPDSFTFTTPAGTNPTVADIINRRFNGQSPLSMDNRSWLLGPSNQQDAIRIDGHHKAPLRLNVAMSPFVSQHTHRLLSAHEAAAIEFILRDESNQVEKLTPGIRDNAQPIPISTLPVAGDEHRFSVLASGLAITNRIADVVADDYQSELTWELASVPA
ncbi:lectin-like domain-containing protein [Lacticaseibacillus saniviri]